MTEAVSSVIIGIMNISNMKTKMSYCDNCGDKFENNNLIPVRNLRFNVASANKGESALLCVMCNYKKIVEYKALQQK